jgi:amino acid adenylation domain-containing protein/non-ribosomal peptide synthase protein (TIGR01720 family)
MSGQTIEGYRLSPQQKRLWTLQQRGAAYEAQCAILLEGEPRAEDLERALRRVIERHEILRTGFRPLPQIKTPVQVIAERGELSWRTCELPAQDERERRAAIERLFEEEARLLSRTGTQLRAALAEAGPGRRVLVLTAPSMCADSKSLHNLMREVARCYAEAGGSASEGGEEAVQYVQFSEWQNELLEDEESAGKGWWRQAAQGAPAAPVLPLEREGSGGEAGADRPTGPREVIERRLGEAEAAALRNLAGGEDGGEEALLLACWQVLLWRLSRQSHFTVGYVCDGRKYEELYDALGLFAKAVPLAVHLEEGMRLDELLGHVVGDTAKAYAWQESYQWQQGGVDAGKQPAPLSAGVGFEYTERPERASVRGVAFSIFKQYYRLENFKLHLTCVRDGDSVVAELHYDPDFFDAADVERLGGQFVTLVRGALESPRARVGELEILSEAERQQLLFGWNHTATEDDIGRLVHELFEEQVGRTPDGVAVACGGERLTYAELNARANRLAHTLRRGGVRAETPVALYLGRSTEMIVGLLGILKAGGAYVPLDTEHPPGRLALQLAEIQSPFMITQAALAGRLPDFKGEIICLNRDRARLEGEAATNPEPSSGPRNLCYVIYTSGSTGSPKGVGVTHRNLVNYALFICRKLRLGEAAGDTPLHFATVSTLSADLGNTCIFPSLISGGCLHVLAQDVVMDGERFVRYLAAHPLDVLKIVPSHLGALMAAAEGRNLLPRKYLLLGGEALTYELFGKISEAAGDCRVINHYGPTETTVGSLTFDASDDAGPPRGGARSVPVGRPIANTQAYVLDRSLKPVPVGVPGELYIGGAGVARGYLDKPAQTAERFVPHHFSVGDGGARLYKTGDLARLMPDGSIEFLGRVDNQVKIRGYRIEPGEIEATLLRHEGVRQAVVLAREDEPGHKRLVAYLVAAGGHAPPVADLRAFLGRSLPDYMIPAAFVTLESLPLTTNGKIDRRALPAPDQLRPELPNRFVAPRNTVEEKLADIWRQVLGVERVGVNDNFFELGGDSILSLQIIARAGRDGLRIAPKQLFEFPTIAVLAPVIGRARAVQEEQGPLTGPVSLTPIQRWFFEQELPDPHHWNMSVMLEARRRLDAALVAEATRHLIVQHDALRLRFDRRAEGWTQTMAKADEPAPFALVDLSASADGEREEAVAASAARFQSSLNLSRGPLLRVVLFDPGAGRTQRLLIIIHHLAVDGVSWRILLEDLQAAYEQLARGEGVALPAKTSSFKEWARRLTEHAQTEAVRAELPYWTSSRAARCAAFPLDYPRGVNDEASARTLETSLDAERTSSLLKEVPAVYHTQINDVLLTALALAFGRWTGDDSLLIDLEGHGRQPLFEDVDLSRTVGWFTTHSPVVLRLGVSADLGGALKSVKEQLRLMPNRGIGHGLLAHLSRDRETRDKLRELPQPQASFNYLGQFDEVVRESGMFSPARERGGHNRSPRGTRQHVLEITAGVLGGELQVSWGYSENLHRRDTVEMLAEFFVEALRSIVAHCQSPGAGGFTPSDFPEAALSQKELDKFLGAIELD